MSTTLQTAVAVIAVVVGLFVLEQAAERLAAAIGALARRLNASEGTVGLLTAGAEWEELVVVVVAMVSGHPGLAIGNVIGACIANLVGSMPLGLLASRPLIPDPSARVYGSIMVLLTALVAALALDGHVTQPAGAMLVALFVIYAVSVVIVVRRGWLRPPAEDEEEDDQATDVQRSSLTRIIAQLLISLMVITLAAEAIVRGAVHIAHQIGLSEYAIGATVIAVGTTLPDKAISLVGGRRGQGGLVTSNAVGSNIFILTLILGLAALASSRGVRIAESVARTDLPLLLAASVLVVVLFFRRRLHRIEGAALLVLYGGYLALALIRG